MRMNALFEAGAFCRRAAEIANRSLFHGLIGALLRGE
jgi:hypothetical protein